MKEERPLAVKFYQSSTGQEPVREWLKGLSIEDKKLIGEDIKDRSVWLATWNAFGEEDGEGHLGNQNKAQG